MNKPKKQLRLNKGASEMNKPKLNKDGILAVIGMIVAFGMSIYTFYIFSQSASVINDFLFGIVKTTGF